MHAGDIALNEVVRARLCASILGDLLMFTPQILRPAVHDLVMTNRRLLAAHSPVKNASRL